jgi:preprotein translocase subunit SecG
MINALLIVQIIVGILLMISILLQKTSSDSIANLAGNTAGIVSARGAANFLTRTTIVLAAAFMINAIILGNLSTKKTTKVIEIEKSIEQSNKSEELPIAK